MEVDSALLSKLAEIDIQAKSCCDLIPLQSWGFDESIHEKLKQRKHRMVNQVLTEKEKKRYSKDEKNYFARSVGGVCSTVSEVLDWMSTSVLKDVQLKKGAPVSASKVTKPEPTEKKDSQKKSKPVEKLQANVPVPKTPVVPQDSEESDSSEDDEVSEHKSSTKPVANVKPVAAVKPIVRTDDKPNGKSEDVKMAEIEESGDSSDEETEPLTVQKGGKKRKAEEKQAGTAKKNKVDEDAETEASEVLDPMEARKVAMQKLQKRIEEMKVQRSGKNLKKSAADAEAERKMKRRMSKMQLKQRRAAEKLKNKTNTEEKKSSEPEKSEADNLPRDEDGKVIYSKFDFVIKDPKKKRLSHKERHEKFTGKDYKSLLNKVEKRDEKLTELREKDPERAVQMEEDIKWNRAIKKAEGIKVKDNVELLKKGLKNKEKAKERRIEKWNRREQRVNAEKDSRQEKRQSNLQKRIDDKKKRKTQKLRAKGRIL